MTTTPPPTPGRLLVAGASSGIGEAVAREALGRGWSVAGLARRADRLAAVEGLEPAVADVTDPTEATAAVQAAVERLGGLDGLVYAVGVNRPGLVADTDHRDWEAVFATNVLGLLTVAKAALPALRAGDDAVAVTITSTSAGRVLSPQNGVYGASKAAVRVLSDALRLELEGEVRVVEVAPGYVRDTEIHRDYEPDHKAQADARQQEHGMERAHVARLVVDLMAQPADVEVRTLTVTRPGYDTLRAYRS